LLESMRAAYTAMSTSRARAKHIQLVTGRRRPEAPSSARAFEEAMREEDVPAEQPEAEEEARLPASHADARRTSRDRAAPVEGPQPPVRLIWRIRDRASFRALAAGRRRRRGVLTVTCAPVAGGPPRVAYVVGRRVGTAVVRNQVRRRLRAVVQAEASNLAPAHVYLVQASPQAALCTYSELQATFRAILRDLHAERA
jgi:ribonuclease P protein component